MRTALRTTIVIALAVPLVGSALPASASTGPLFRDKGPFADAYFEGVGTPGGLLGDYSFGSLTLHGTDLAEGFVDTFDCDEGETPWGDHDGENACDIAGSYEVWGSGFTVVSGKGKDAASTYSGVVNLYDVTTEEGALAAEGVPFEFTLTANGGSSRSTFTYTYSDPESGVTFRSREIRSYSFATVEGGFDGVPAVGGSVGTYSVRSIDRIS